MNNDEQLSIQWETIITDFRPVDKYLLMIRNLDTDITSSVQINTAGTSTTIPNTKQDYEIQVCAINEIGMRELRNCSVVERYPPEVTVDPGTGEETSDDVDPWVIAVIIILLLLLMCCCCILCCLLLFLGWRRRSKAYYPEIRGMASGHVASKLVATDLFPL